MARFKRLTALTVCAALMIVLLVSSLFFIHEVNHTCIGENCRVCAQLANLGQQLKKLLSFQSIPGALALPCCAAAVFCALAAAERGGRSLVALKVKLSE